MFAFPAAIKILFLKAMQFGLFDASTQVSGYVKKKTGKYVASYRSTRKHANKPSATGSLFGEHETQQEAKKPRKQAEPKPISAEKRTEIQAKIAHIIAHAKVDALHASEKGSAYRKIYLAKLETIKGIPDDLLSEAKQTVEGLFGFNNAAPEKKQINPNTENKAPESKKTLGWTETGRTKPQNGDKVYKEKYNYNGIIDHIKGVVKNGRVYNFDNNQLVKLDPSWTKEGEETPRQKQENEKTKERIKIIDEFEQKMRKKYGKFNISANELKVGDEVVSLKWPDGDKPLKILEITKNNIILSDETNGDTSSRVLGKNIIPINRDGVVIGFAKYRKAGSKESPAQARLKPESVNYETMVKIAADSISKLRAVDVYRVLEESPNQNRAGLASYIKQHRPDLVDDVDDAMIDLPSIDPEPPKPTSPAPKKRGRPAKPKPEGQQNAEPKKRGRPAKVNMQSELKPENKAPEDKAATVQAASEGKTQKEPWEMTLAELNATGRIIHDTKTKSSRVWEQKNPDTASNATEHRRQVISALAAGKPVPPEVLADYPDLKDIKPKAKVIAAASAPKDTPTRPGMQGRTGLAPKKRGRPAKPKPEGQQNAEPKKRGRPAKVKMESELKPENKAPEDNLSEDRLKELELIRDFRGVWQYRISSQSGNWFTANSKEGAIKQAIRTYNSAISRGETLKTRAEKDIDANLEYDAENERLFGVKTLDELKKMRDKLENEIKSLQQAGLREFNGRDRRTSSAVSNEGARNVGELKMRLNHYIKNKEESMLRQNKAPEDGPKEGERNADGLVFRNGRWHRDDEKSSTSARAKPALTPESNGFSDDPNSPNYRFKDTGYIAGSRKEEAATSIRTKAKAGTRVLANEIDWEEIEKNPREAKELIKKSNLFGKVDWVSLRENGMEPGAGFLLDRIYAAVPQEPDEDTPQKRQDYALALESLRSRMEKCKSTDELLSVLDEIRDEMEGAILNEEQSKAYEKAMDAYRQKKAVVKQAKKEIEELNAKRNPLIHELHSLEYAQEKRTRRGWKPDPEIQSKLNSLHKELDDNIKKIDDYFIAHPEMVSKKQISGIGERYTSDLEFEVDELGGIARDILKKAKANNLINNPVTRAWLTLGQKFMAVAKRGDTFTGHIVNVRNNRVKDWSWAEKEGATIKRATKQEVKFQLKVAEKYDRIGGRKVSADSTAAFKSMFGLRDVQSGNWVLNDSASAAWHVQKSTEAFADLADLLGAEDRHVSMNGRLAMAFGARGHGSAGGGSGARAHYEPVHRVINLTKMGGGGTLAHEWAHALDNLCIEVETGKPGGIDDFASENPSLLPPGPLRDAFGVLQFAMRAGTVQTSKSIAYTATDIKIADINFGGNKSANHPLIKGVREAGNANAAVKSIDDYYGDTSKMTAKNKKRVDDWRRAAVAYYDRNPEGGVVMVKTGPTMSSFAAGAIELDLGRSNGYWSQTREMFARAFQAYCEDKLAEQGRGNDYLSAMADNRYYPGFKPFPEGEERERINNAFDRLIAALKQGNILEKAYVLFFKKNQHARQRAYNA